MTQGTYKKAEDVRARISLLTDPYWSNTARTYAGFSDSQFYLPTRQEVDQFLSPSNENSVVEVPESIGEGFDCDDFAFVLKGKVCLYARDKLNLRASMCLGIAWARFDWIGDTLHSVNWVLYDSLEFAWIEPQDLSIHNIHACRGELQLLIV